MFKKCQRCSWTCTFFKVSLDDKRKMLSKILWNSTIDNKKLAKVSFKEPFETLADSAKNTDIDNPRGVRDAIRTFSE